MEHFWQKLIVTYHYAWKEKFLTSVRVLPALTYGDETWTLTSKTIQRLQTTQSSMERCMLDITRRDRKRITWIRNYTKLYIMERIKRLKWKWAGHIARRQDNRWTTSILDWYPCCGVKRPRRRPHARWIDEIRKVARVNWMAKASDRSEWEI